MQVSKAELNSGTPKEPETAEVTYPSSYIWNSNDYQMVDKSVCSAFQDFCFVFSQNVCVCSNLSNMHETVGSRDIKHGCHYSICRFS